MNPRAAILLLSFWLGLSPMLGQYQKTEVFFDDFVDNRTEWPTKNIEGRSRLYFSNGKYYFEHLRDSRSWIISKILELDDQRDFEIETRVEWISGVNNYGYGLVWGRENSENNYCFIISGSGYYKVKKDQDNVSSDLIPWTKSPAVNTGSHAVNVLTIQKTGGIIAFRLNGHLLGHKPFEPFFGPRVGFIIYHHQQIAVDYLRMSYLQSEPEGPLVDHDIPVSPSTQASTYALVIGNEDYSSHQKGLTTEQNVDYAENDAKVFAAYCEKTLGIPERHIKLVTNATAAQIYQGLAWMSNLAKVENGNAKLIFYYSGHGLPHEQTKEAYIMPVDVSGAHVEYAVKVDEVYEKLTEHPSRQVTVFLDACFSGGARDQGLVAVKGVKIKPREDLVQGNLVVFSSSTGEESSGVYRDKNHGYFTYFLLKKLQETKGDIDYNQLSDFLIRSVQKETALEGKVQTPRVNVSPVVGENWKNWRLK